MRVAVSLGSNLGDREGALRHAVIRLSALPGISGVHTSSLYETDPVGGVAQPNFLNAVAVATAAGHAPLHVARELLDLARSVESDLHRQRRERWGPRTVDVDVLAVGDLINTDPELTVPHPRLSERAFVLVPWAEVDPDFVVPQQGRVTDLLQTISQDERAGVRWHGVWPGDERTDGP